jgi:hypothetical protein
MSDKLPTPPKLDLDKPPSEFNPYPAYYTGGEDMLRPGFVVKDLGTFYRFKDAEDVLKPGYEDISKTSSKGRVICGLLN